MVIGSPSGSVATAGEVALAAGQVIFQAGEPADALYVLEAGRLEVRTVKMYADGALLRSVAVAPARSCD